MTEHQPGQPSAPAHDPNMHKETLALLKAKRRFLSVWMIVGAGILAGAAIYMLNILSATVSILLWTLLIVFCLRGIVDGLERHRVPRLLGTTVAFIVFFASLFLIGAILLSPTIGFNEQVRGLIASIPDYANRISDLGNGLYDQYSYVLQNDVAREWINEASNALTVWASDLARNSAGNVVAFSTGFANGLMYFSFALVVAFWLLMELPALGRECLRLGGERYYEDLRMLHVTSSRVMGGYIKGTILQCAIIALACGFAFAYLQLPNYAALAAITGLLNIIPVVGPLIGGLVAAFVALFISPMTAVITIIAVIVIQQVVYTFISPKIMANSVDLHPVLIILALMAGSSLGSAMGGVIGAIVGMLASIPLIAIAKSIFVYYFEKRTGRTIVSPDGVFFQGQAAEDAFDPLHDATAPQVTEQKVPEVVEDTTKQLKKLLNRVK